MLEGASFYSRLTTLQVTSFSSFIELARNILSVDEMKLLVIMMWSNWKECNSVVHGVPPKPPVVCYGNCVSIWKCLLEVQVLDMTRQRHRLNVVQGELHRWRPPYLGYAC